MLQIIKTTKELIDRLVINVIPFDTDDYIKFDNTNCTRFIAAEANLEFNDISIKHNCVAAATTKEFAIGEGKGVIIEMPGYYYFNDRFTTVAPGIPGNLSYIDGCSNSNLIDPARNGEPCLNYLYFPKHIDQTFHTHPSVRIGFILSGSGIAETPEGEIPLTAGDVFVLDRFCRHRFKTADSHMSLIAFHPDSEDGPRDEQNPMKTRTYL